VSCEVEFAKEEERDVPHVIDECVAKKRVPKKHIADIDQRTPLRVCAVRFDFGKGTGLGACVLWGVRSLFLFFVQRRVNNALIDKS